MTRVIHIGHDAARMSIGGDRPYVLIAGPCVIESFDKTRDIAKFLKELCVSLGIPLIFKASYDKANRTSGESYRGPGITQGLQMLGLIQQEFKIPVLTDVHSQQEVPTVGTYLDVLQVPALLCRQTDVVQAIARTGKPVNIKKGQFLSPWDVCNVIEKVRSTGNDQIMITERGTMFGYNNLVVDFRSFPILKTQGYPVIFDATHSVQLPGGGGTHSTGQREYIPTLAKAAIAAGVDGIFLEVHPDPDNALCDGPNSLPLEELPALLKQLNQIQRAIR